ncbi:hypothetical protein JHC27_01740 [archaeon]|nr:hypothetical protein [archaeon]
MEKMVGVAIACEKGSVSEHFFFVRSLLPMRLKKIKLKIQLFLVSTEDQLKEAQNKFLGELHEVQD